jgi:hypothetical protein
LTKPDKEAPMAKKKLKKGKKLAGTKSLRKTGGDGNPY